MFLSALISKNNMNPTAIKTTATVTLGAGPAITKIELVNETTCPGLTQDKFKELAAEAKANCPITKALAGVQEVTLSATLK